MCLAATFGDTCTHALMHDALKTLLRHPPPFPSFLGSFCCFIVEAITAAAKYIMSRILGW
jgi:hypothetical protein